MAKSTIVCRETGDRVVVDVDIAITALESLGKREREIHTLENCPACGKSHNWTTADISAVTDG